MASPYKPDKEEQKYYFHGFSGSPKLVARTGHNRWTKLLLEHGWEGELVQCRKRYMALNDPDTIGKWSKDLSMDIITALGQCKWSYFFPIRTCLSDDNFPPKGVATILLVAVEPTSLQWEDGIVVALSCRDIIRKYGVFDLEVEIMEGCYTEYAAHTQLEAYFSKADPKTSKIISPLLSYVGYSIAYSEERNGQGTVGLHVKLGADESTVYGLTCRHVVCNNRTKNEWYKPQAKDRQYHIQANQYTFGKIQSNLKSVISHREDHVKELQTIIQKWDNWYQFDQSKSHRAPTEAERKDLASTQSHLAHDTAVEKILEQVEDRDQRQIGHLAFHPTYSMSPQQHGYLRDWALVQLDPSKFTRLDNGVFIGFEEDLFYNQGFEQILHLRDKDEVSLKPSYDVAKRGATTGLTLGTKSGIEAVVRRPGYGLDGGDIFTWEILIVPEHDPGRFSKAGDSGAAVFDSTKHVVGIITGSNGVQNDGSTTWRGVPDKNVAPQDADKIPASDRVELSKSTDITFVAPIKWVLDDIQDFTGQKVRLA